MCIRILYSSLRSFLIVLVGLTFLSSFSLLQALAQGDPAAGILPFSTQATEVYESVDLATGNVNVRIPVRNKIGKIPFAYNLVMNSHAYYLPGQSPAWVVNGVPNVYHQSGLTGQSNVGVQVAITTSNVRCGVAYYNTFVSGVWVVDSTGAQHSVGLQQPIYTVPPSQSGCLPNATTGTTTDGSGYTLLISYATGSVEYTLYDKFGNQYVPQTSQMNSLIQDPDGVGMTSSWSNPTTTITDTLGATAIMSTLGQSGNPDTYKYTDATGSNTQTFQVNYSPYTQATAFGCTTGGSGTAPKDILPVSVYLPSSVTTPTGTITFTYEITPGDTHTPHYVTGRLAGITYLSGGSVSYTYGGGNNGVNCSSQAVPTLTRTVNDNNGNVNTWKYVNSNASWLVGNYTVTVTDPAGNQSVDTFWGEYLTEALDYEGTAAGTPLKTVFTCYNQNYGSQSACTSLGGANPFAITQMDVYTYLGSSTSPSLAETQYDAYGDVTAVSNYDFGATYPPSGSPTTKTTISYDSGGSCGTLAIPYMYAFPCSITMVNSSNSRVSQTNYTYNSTGHPTQISKWVGGSTYLTSSAAYASNGVVTSVTDVNNAVTNYSNGPGVGACNGLLPVGTTYPKIGGVQMSTSQTWDCNGGVVTSTTDPNGQITGKSTTINYVVNNVADPFYRPRSVVDPLGNTTNLSYSPTTFESAMNFNGTKSTSDTLITTDGLGRQIFAQTRQGQGSSTFDTVQTTYGWTTTTAQNPGGPFTITSVPYSGTAGASAPSGTGATTTQYDAVGRPLSVSDSGGGSTTYQYIKQDTVATVGPAPANENPKIHQYEYNGLGWLTSVCEVTAGTTSYPGQSCSPQVNPQTGYLTKYSYNALGKLQTVTQSANGSYAQGRSYTYDGIGRLTQEQNPESGTVNYTYDSIASGNCSGSYLGDLVMTVDYAGNVVCDQYDGLHRITAVTYPAGVYSSVTPAKNFVYDTTSETCSDPTGANVKGRLSEAYTGTSGTKKVDTLYCYSPRGQTTDMYQSTPSSAGYAHLVMTYWANGQTETINGIHQLSDLLYSVDGEGRTNGFDPTALTPDPVKTVSYNPASQITNVNFASGETDAYSYDVMNRVNKYTYVLGSSSLIGAPTWNANGTLGTLNITDQFNSLNNQNCTYTHDDLVRISNVSCTGSGWGQAFTYDPFGNITKSGSSSWTPAYYASNGSTSNQYVGGGATYDSNGNLTYDTFNHYTWDADGNIATVNGSTTNTYDASDKLVETSVGPTQFLYLPGGTQPFATMSNYKSFLKVFAPAPGGTMVITPNGSDGVLAYHRHTDWIGSSRFATTPAETVYFDGAYAPFGEPYATSGTNDFVFGGNAQDASMVEGATSGYAYDTLNRKYSAAQSRWIAPDPAGLAAADLNNPQSWNLYAYVLNNPLSNIDPLGLYCAYLNDDGTGIESIDDTVKDNNPDPVGECGSNGGYWIVGSYGGGSWVNINVDTGTVRGLGYDSSGNAEISVAGAMGSNAWGAWTQTFPAAGLGPPGGNNSWLWTAIKSFFTFGGGPGNVPTCAGQALRHMGNTLNPFTPGVSTATEAAAPVAQAVAINQGIAQTQVGIDAYVATKGLTVPLRSSIVRAMAAEGAEGAVAAGARANLAVQTLAVDYAAINSTITTAGEARNGQCAAALPIF
jgi:RHS repeat-associated protein